MWPTKAQTSLDIGSLISAFIIQSLVNAIVKHTTCKISVVPVGEQTGFSLTWSQPPPSRGQKFNSSARNYKWNLERKSNSRALERITQGSNITYYSHMFFIAYTFKGQVHVFAGRVKIVSHWSCRTSAIFKYFCPLSPKSGLKKGYQKQTSSTLNLEKIGVGRY